jgi:hypothetical protein
MLHMSIDTLLFTVTARLKTDYTLLHDSIMYLPHSDMVFAFDPTAGNYIPRYLRPDNLESSFSCEHKAVNNFFTPSDNTAPSSPK